MTTCMPRRAERDLARLIAAGSRGWPALNGQDRQAKKKSSLPKSAPDQAHQPREARQNLKQRSAKARAHHAPACRSPIDQFPSPDDSQICSRSGQGRPREVEGARNPACFYVWGIRGGQGLRQTLTQPPSRQFQSSPRRPIGAGVCFAPVLPRQLSRYGAFWLAAALLAPWRSVSSAGSTGCARAPETTEKNGSWCFCQTELAPAARAWELVSGAESSRLS